MNGTAHGRAWGGAVAALRVLCLSVLLIAMLSNASSGQGGAARAPAPCRQELIGTAVVSAVEDERTVRLEDGRVARLAGIETAIPSARAPQARLMLEAMLVGHSVTLRRIGPETDRYGRIMAQIFVPEGGVERWVQSDLVARGQAVVGARVGDRACAAELLNRERRARDDKLGVWAEAGYVIRRAEDADALVADDGRFAIVEGRVLSVRESGGTVYINFGRRWSREFAIIVLKRNEHKFVAANLEPRRLEGRRVRVRGWVDVRSGPAVEALLPEQIEVLDTR
jgi:endonuclease YncB( thermonuclease family)